MKTLSELVELINNTCGCFGGYNEILVKDCVVAFTLYNNIAVDTKNWDNLIDYLWSKLENIHESFDNNKEQFDNYLASDLV